MDSLKDAYHQTKKTVVSPSLIRTPPSDVNWNDYKSFDLGLDQDWQWLADEQCVENIPPEVPPELEREVEPDFKKPRLSLLLKKLNKAGHSEGRNLRLARKNITNKPHITAGAQQPERNQFASPVTENQLKKAADGVVPENIRRNTQWAKRNFTSWAIQCNQQVPEDPVPLDLLRSHDAELVCKSLCKFVLETRNSSGQHYPPATIRALLSGIN